MNFAIIPPENLTIICQFLSQNPKVSKIQFKNNIIGNKGAKLINQILNLNQNIIKIKFNPLDSIKPKIKNEIKEKLKINESFIKDPLVMDFLKLFKDEILVDCELPYNIKSHKLLLKYRTGLTVHQLTEILKGFEKKEIIWFLIWVYTSKMVGNLQIINKIFQLCNLNIKASEQKKKLETDLLNLYNDNQSKDLTITLSNSEIIKIHKFIFVARTNLYTNILLASNEKQRKTTNIIRDYSKRSLKAMQIFIQFLYTEQFPLPQTQFDELNKVNEIIEQLSDAKDYFQLNKNSTFPYKLSKLKIPNNPQKKFIN